MEVRTKADWCLLLNVPNEHTPIEPERLEALERILASTKRLAIQELLEQHKKDRAKVSSKCDLINMSTVERYLEGL